MTLAIVSCSSLPEPDLDQETLEAALDNRGLKWELVGWDDPKKDFNHYDLCVIRSTWNYHERLDAFLDWVGQISSISRLLNPGEVVCWNCRKTYLTDLSRSGVNVVPTIWLAKGEHPAMDALVQQLGQTELVIKPTVSLGSYATFRFDAKAQQEQLEHYLNEYGQQRDLMVQPYMSSVEKPGEHSLIYIGNQLSHVVRKSARFSTDQEHTRLIDDPPKHYLEFAARVLTCMPFDADDLLYARVDLVEDAQGQCCLAELELIEPSLFLFHYPPAADRLVDQISQALDQPQ